MRLDTLIKGKIPYHTAYFRSKKLEETYYNPVSFNQYRAYVMEEMEEEIKSVITKVNLKYPITDYRILFSGGQITLQCFRDMTEKEIEKQAIEIEKERIAKQKRDEAKRKKDLELYLKLKKQFEGND